MKRLCPVCFTELPEKANYCPMCGKCMRDAIMLPRFLGGRISPHTRAIGVADRAIHVEDGKQGGE